MNRYAGQPIESLENIKRGMYVTVLKPKQLEHLSFGDDDDKPWSESKGKTVNMQDPESMIKKIMEAMGGRTHPLEGVPLLVSSVSAPYVAVVLVPDGDGTVLDTRKVALTPVTEEYARFFVNEKEYVKRFGPEVLDPEAAEQVMRQANDRIEEKLTELLDGTEPGQEADTITLEELLNEGGEDE